MCRGAFAVVKRAVHKATGKLYAVKIVDKRRLALVNTSRDLVKAEVDILRRCNHRYTSLLCLMCRCLLSACALSSWQAHCQVQRHVRQQEVSLHCSGVVRAGLGFPFHVPCLTSDGACCASVDGGELFDKIIESGTFPEADAKALFRQIAKAIAYLHAQKISHRFASLWCGVLLGQCVDGEHVSQGSKAGKHLAQENSSPSARQPGARCEMARKDQ